MINYSIIIPHKNIPNLLQRCLDSIPRREDVQIIVVDDNSDVDKVDFVNFPGLNDPYVEIVFSKNENGRKGAGYARNLGLERAKGKWLIFADADDFFSHDFEKALNKYESDDSDIIYFYVDSIYLETLQCANRHQKYNKILDKLQKVDDWDYDIDLCTPWGKFIKRETVKKHNISFQEVQCANDVLFYIKLSSFVLKKSISTEKIYTIVDREESLTKKRNTDAIRMRFNVMCDAAGYLKKNHKEESIRECVFSWWREIYNINKSTAFFLLQRMFKLFGIYFVLKRIYKMI